MCLAAGDERTGSCRQVLSASRRRKSNDYRQSRKGLQRECLPVRQSRKRPRCLGVSSEARWFQPSSGSSLPGARLMESGRFTQDLVLARGERMPLAPGRIPGRGWSGSHASACRSRPASRSGKAGPESSVTRNGWGPGVSFGDWACCLPIAWTAVGRARSWPPHAVLGSTLEGLSAQRALESPDRPYHERPN